MRRMLVGLLGGMLLVGVPGLVPAGAGAAKKRPPTARLSAFSSCPDLVAYARRYASSPGVAFGVPARAVPQPAVPFAGLVPAPAPGQGGTIPQPVAAVPTAENRATTDTSFSGTNNQEAAVDEADIAKTQDGTRLFALAAGALTAYDITADTPKLLGTLKLEGTPRALLLRGDRALVIAQDGGGGPMPLGDARVAPAVAGLPFDAASIVRLTEVAIGDPAKLSVSRTLTVDGSYVAGRLTGGTARVVLNTPPELDFGSTEPAPAPGVAPPAVAAAKRPGLRAFVPETILRSRITNRTFRRSLVGCGEVRRPARYAGLDLLTVLTVDLDKGLFNVDRDAVMAGAETVYASERSLVVASRRYIAGFDRPADVPETMTTQIHRFDTSEAGETTYAASGSVPGFVLNQFSISEHERALRVATTEDPLWLDGAPQRDSESGVSVLRQDGSRLVTSGRAGGLGKGERIYAVRFLGERGYVVTFRQVDPLYVLDLRDPAAPKVTAEQGVRAGGQVSLFDVSNPAAPRRLQQRAFGSGSSSEVEWDHLAFLWWEPAKLAMLPLQQYGPDPAAAFTGAVGLRVERTGITEAGRVTHGNDPYPALVRRSFVAGGRVITVSDRGLAASRLDTLAPLGFAAFPPAG
ncbi:MAG: beta-propeller domain-containing protein [Solirubrobacteraceae bacterium]|nr:beta-propeller domain-containing protein [Solirubrobacteraceae bacterium]